MSPTLLEMSLKKLADRVEGILESSGFGIESAPSPKKVREIYEKRGVSIPRQEEVMIRSRMLQHV